MASTHHHGHAHGHGHHHHAPVAPGADPRRALFAALVLNAGFLVVEVGAGWWTGSLALLSDAAHMTSDVVALAMALGAAQLARRAATPTMTFGLHRTETLGAFVNGLALLVAVAVILHEAWDRLASGAPAVGGLPVLVVGAIGLAINLGSAWWLWRSDRDNLNVRGALAHMLADALGSVGAVIAAVFLLLGVPAADPIVSVVIAALVAWGAWQVLRESTRVLLQLPPPDFAVTTLLADLLDVDGVDQVHDLHVWTLDGNAPIVTAHLVVGASADPVALVAQATRVVRERHHAEHVTFQVEAADDAACSVRGCGASAPTSDPHHDHDHAGHDHGEHGHVHA
ncbi:MAG: cation transporter [Alphaproteobacteria bacterium]|nr:cation transporter [Alphaproteobacteria bacterium]